MLKRILLVVCMLMALVAVLPTPASAQYDVCFYYNGCENVPPEVYYQGPCPGGGTVNPYNGLCPSPMGDYYVTSLGAILYGAGPEGAAWIPFAQWISWTFYSGYVLWNVMEDVTNACLEATDNNPACFPGNTPFPPQ